MKKPGKNLQQRSLSLLQVLMILGVTFVATTVVLQLQVEYNLLILIYAQPHGPGQNDPGGGPGRRPGQRRHPPRGRAAVRAAAQRDDPGDHPHPPGPEENHPGHPPAAAVLPQLLHPVGAGLPGRPGAGRPGPELRGGAAHHGPRGDLDPAAHQPPAGQRGDHRHRRHPGRDPRGEGAPPPGGGRQTPGPDDRQHHRRPGDLPGGRHPPPAVGGAGLPGPLCPGGAGQALQRHPPGGHPAHHPPPGPGEVRPLHGPHRPADGLPGRQPAPGGGVPGEERPGPGL